MTNNPAAMVGEENPLIRSRVASNPCARNRNASTSNAGNNARVLARYVRELKLLRLEEAIRRMTSLPAATFRLKERGQLREGNRADLVVFDPARVESTATFPDPHHYAVGFAAVLVNGVVVVRNDAHTGARPGQMLRHAAPVVLPP